ncbi:MAG: ClbS/DfsB family four-helix bundle protein [Lachnospiraceae bacterium]|nr:ClbS/DfsB family four-helix bundle protein [Lachnospiraceae bacterium]
MSRPTTKTDLLTAATVNFEKLNTLILGLTETELSMPLDFSNDEKKKEAHWKRDKNLRDILIHLYEWHQLLLNWVQQNQNGHSTPFLPQPYNWRTYGEMNMEFWNKHQGTSLEDARNMFQKSHREVAALAECFSNDELFSKGMIKWVPGSTLGSYFVSTTSSHYDWAMKKLKAHKKNCANVRKDKIHYKTANKICDNLQ